MATSSNSIFDVDGEHLFSSDGGDLKKLMLDNLPFPESTKCVPLNGTKEKGYSEVFRNEKAIAKLKSKVSPGKEIYAQLFENSVEKSPDSGCLAYRKHDYENNTDDGFYTEITYSEVNDMKKKYGAGLLHLLSCSPFKNSNKYESHRKIDNHIRDYKTYNKDNISFILTLYSLNRYEWVLTDIMTSSFAITNTALYDTLGPSTSEYILETTESPVVATSKNHVSTILELKRNNRDTLDHLIMIISFDPLDLSSDSIQAKKDRILVEQCEQENISLVDLNQVMKIGEIFPLKELHPSPESLYTISFTSGTTGARPKGVMLTHSCACAGLLFPVAAFGVFENGRSFSFLPLAHIFERQNAAFVMSYGGLLGFPKFNGTPLTLIEDMKLFKPMHMANVPRVFTRIESVLKQATIESPSLIKRLLFSKGIQSKMDMQSSNVSSDLFYYDKILSKPLRKAVGYEDMKFVITGSAPISPSTIKFLRAALNIGMAQGYGLTESFAGVAASQMSDPSPGSCGIIGLSCELRLRELPEMGYTSTDAEGPRGELLLRGPAITCGYFKNDEENMKAFDKDGWFLTGDVAHVCPRTGNVSIIDRVKNFFKLSQGEYVTPEKIEGVYLSSIPIFTQFFIHGDSLRSYLVGIVGIDLAETRYFLRHECKVPRSSLMSDNDIISAINEKENKKVLVNYINSKVKNLKGFEKVHNLFLDVEPLTLERDVVTPTQKIKRAIASKFFKEQIDSMYEEGSLLTTTKL